MSVCYLWENPKGVFEILENFWDNVCFGVYFYRSRRYQNVYKIAAYFKRYQP